MKKRKTWGQSVLKHCLLSASGNKVFTRKELLGKFLKDMVGETRSIGKTPKETVSRVLQELRDIGLLK